MKEHKQLAFLTSGALAACIGLVVWLGIGPATPVSAATIFDDFKTAIRNALSIRLEGIDLGTVQVHGEIVLDRSPDGSTDPTRYAEVHVLMKADNRKWNDLDAAIVICQTPHDAWYYCRGTGGGGSAGTPDYHVEPTEDLIEGRAWSDFVHEPLEGFGHMPEKLSFAMHRSGADGVTYRFMKHQRAYVESLLRFLLDLSGSETAGELIDGLQSAGRIILQRRNDGMYVLHASHLGQIVAFEPTDDQLPDAEALLEDAVWELNYDLTQKRITGWATENWPEQLSEFGVGMDDAPTDGLPTESVDELIAHLESLSREVEVEEASDTTWKIRVTGYPLPLDTSSVNWRERRIPALLESMTLSVYYDTEAKVVTRAEFHGVGSPEGRIMLEIGQVNLDERRLSPDFWITPNTEVYEHAGD